ncbi:hypothetical protein Agub_g11104, partial [Astrephomene gubernaculifera]
VTLLVLRQELPACLLGCGGAATAVMSLLGKLAARWEVRHEQLFEGGGSSAAPTTGATSSSAAAAPYPAAYAAAAPYGPPPAYASGSSGQSMREWVVGALRECLLAPLRGAAREVQQAFVAAVAGMPEQQLDFKMKIPLLEWARGARVPVATIFDAASRAVANATRSLEGEASSERAATQSAVRDATAREAVAAHSGAMLQQLGLEVRASAADGVAAAATAAVEAARQVRERLELALAASSGQGGLEKWIEDKRTPMPAGVVVGAGAGAGGNTVPGVRPMGHQQQQQPAAAAAVASGHRSWVWHVLKWVGERLLEEMAGAESAAVEGGEGRGGAAAGAGGTRGSRRNRSRDVSPSSARPAAGGSSSSSAGSPSSDPRVMLRQLVERTGSFRGPELLPLALTLMEVVARDGPGSPFLDPAHSLLTRCVLPEAGRAAALATNDAWRSAEYRAGLLSILERWMEACEVAEAAAATAAPPPQRGRRRSATGGGSNSTSPAGSGGGGGGGGGGSVTWLLPDELVERVAFTLALAEGSVGALRTASAVLNVTRPTSSSSSQQLRRQSSSRHSSPSRPPASGRTTRASAAAANAASPPPADAQPSPTPARLELLLPVQCETGAVAAGGGGGFVPHSYKAPPAAIP